MKTIAIAIVALMIASVYGQSTEQRQKASEYKCSFSGKLLSQNGSRQTNWQTSWGSYDKSKTRGQSYLYTFRLNSKTQETFKVESYFMAAANRKTFACAKEEFDITLTRGITTNVVVSSPLLSSREENYSSIGYRRKEGGKIVGVIGRLKKDGVIVKTYCSMMPWAKMAWQDDITVTKLED